MSKELGEQLNANFVKKVANNMFLTYHSQDRIAERCPSLIGQTLQETLENVAKEIKNCKFAYNNNDGSINIVLQNDYTIVFAFNDKYKKWHMVTIKEHSQNGFSTSDKWIIARLHSDKTKHSHKADRMTDYSRKPRTKHTKPYKRDNRWKGKDYGF